MNYKKFALLLFLICLIGADSLGIKTLLQISKENGVLKIYQDPYDTILKEVKYFPVAESKTDEKKTVTYYDSFMQERTYGGQRGHEGCDIMASYIMGALLNQKITDYEFTGSLFFDGYNEQEYNANHMVIDTETKYGTLEVLYCRLS